MPPQPIRGGVPVCWPYFGRQGQAADLPQHGFARTAPWRVLEQRIEASAVTLQLALPAIQGTALQLTQTLRIGAELRQSLHTHNPGGEPVTCVITINGKVTERRSTDGPYGRTMCQG